MSGAIFGDIMGSSHKYEKVKYADSAKSTLFREERANTKGSIDNMQRVLCAV